MAKQRPEKGRGLFYSRDSDARHEMTPSKYVEWAVLEANKLGVEFTGTPEAIDRMIRDGLYQDGDIFFDFKAQGHIFSRQALDALGAEIAGDLKR